MVYTGTPLGAHYRVNIPVITWGLTALLALDHGVTWPNYTKHGLIILNMA